MQLVDSTAAFGCHCPSCMAGATHHTLPVTSASDANAVAGPGSQDGSLDPKAGGEYRDKPIWDLQHIAENLNRTGFDWSHDNYGELNDKTLSFGFWADYRELSESYYVNKDGTTGFNEAYYASDFSPFNADQIGIAQKAIGLWGDLIDVKFVQTLQYHAAQADIVYGNTSTGGAQAYAYLPFGDTDDQYYEDTYGFSQTGRLGGDVWIDGFVPSNFFPVTSSYYATTTMIHETGHALGLSHPGNYNAIGPDGQVLDPTYENQAEYAQDSLQYSIMSYFDGYQTGAQFIDFQLLNFAYPSTPMIHDIAAIQAIYGANMETRAGDTVYGFNSTETGTAYDFAANNRPVLSIWDGGGKDTIDVSGFKTNSLINLNAGAFSSAGGADHFYTLDEINEARTALGFAVRTQATYDYYQDLIARLGVTNPGFKDNISIAYGATIENATTGNGDDKIVANDVANIIHAGRGNDTISYESATAGVSVGLRNGAVEGNTFHNGTASGAAGDQLFGIENAIGSKFNDRLSGTNAANVLNGGAGDDYLIGRGGADTFVFRTDLNRGTGHDTIRDFSNDDYLATSTALPTDGHGRIAVTNGTLVLNSATGDSVTFADGGPSELRLVGLMDGKYYYVSSDNGTADQASLAKLAAPADTLEDAAAQAKAMAAAAAHNGPAEADLAQRVEGWKEASETGHGAGTGTAEHLDLSKSAPNGAFAEERGSVHGGNLLGHGALPHMDYVTFHLA